MPKRLASLLLIVAVVVTTAAGGAPAPQDNRAPDREAIRAHIDRIFQAFIQKDGAELRATHDKNWLGYLEGWNMVIRGIGGYMEDAAYGIASADYGMTG